MTFVSYAQNFEDVMLWRALKHVGAGFYIDVGANDPSVDSVTRAFYERGWHGINIEPLPSHCADLRAQRARDITLQCAVGAQDGELQLWECEVRGWATAVPEVVAQHEADGHRGRFQRVAVRRLADICAEHAAGEIHFLKIDVEGAEEDVLRGMDFARFRPWILVIEATRPNLTQEVHQQWEGLVLDAGYLLAYRDGLNRFYVAPEHRELLEALRYPPNVFDGFTLARQQLPAPEAVAAAATRAEASARQWEAELRQMQERLQQVESGLEQAAGLVRAAEEGARQAVAEAEAALQGAARQRADADTNAHEAGLRSRQWELRANELDRQLGEARGQAEHWQRQAHQWHARVVTLHRSHSWRLSAPLRSLKRVLQGDFSPFPRAAALVSRGFQAVLRPLALRAARGMLQRPALRRRIDARLQRHPWLRQRLVAFARGHGLLTGVATVAVAPAAEPGMAAMTPHARKVHAMLLAAIERQRNGD